MKFEIVPAHELSLADQAALFNEAFTGYVGGSFHLDAAGLTAFICAQGIDLCYSRFARNHTGNLVGFGYINSTAGISRLAGMGTVPDARRSGVAGLLLDHCLDEAKARGDTVMTLEVIEQNPAAVALYRRHGFGEVTRLFGWRSTGERITKPGVALRDISLLNSISLPASWEYPALPWPISRHVVAKKVFARAYALDDLAVVISDPTNSPIRIIAYPGFTGTNWESLRTLTAGLFAKFSGSEFYTVPVFPEEFGTELFEPLKFRKEEINQFLMRKDL